MLARSHDIAAASTLAGVKTETVNEGLPVVTLAGAVGIACTRQQAREHGWEGALIGRLDSLPREASFECEQHACCGDSPAADSAPKTDQQAASACKQGLAGSMTSSALNQTMHAL
jgi:hypothetical protein